MTPRRLLRFWFFSTLFCGINGFLAYTVAPSVRGADPTYTAPLYGLAAGLLCALGATLLLGLYGLIARLRRTPAYRELP